MTFEMFKDCVTTRLMEQLPQGTTITSRRVAKNNNLILDGLVINREGIPLSPTIYLNEYYTACDRDHIPFEELISDILSQYQKLPPADALITKDLADFDRIKDRLVFRLVNQHKNKPLLKQMPYMPYLDLAVTLLCLVSVHEENDACISVKNEHLAMWGMSAEELFSQAKANTPTTLAPVLTNIADLLPLAPMDAEPLLPEPGSLSCPMYVLTNRLKLHGAGCLLYEGLLSGIAKKLGGDFVILPSSIHELILIPAAFSPDADVTNDMIREVNRTSVAADEYLSDHSYYYCADTDTVTLNAP